MLHMIFSYLFIIGSFSPYAGEMTDFLVSYQEKKEAAMENEAFQKIKVNGQKGSYVVTGEVRAGSREFFYVVEDGHNEYISEKKLEVKETTAKNWSSFNIKIEVQKEEFPESGNVILYLYERNKDGQRMNELPILLEKIQ